MKGYFTIIIILFMCVNVINTEDIGIITTGKLEFEKKNTTSPETNNNPTINTTCAKESIYQTNGPVNIYLHGGTAYTSKDQVNTMECNCPPGPQGPTGPRGPPGPPGSPEVRGTNAPLLNNIYGNGNVESSNQQFVAFFAVMHADFGPHTTIQRVIFDRVLTNIGEAYNRHRGVFTVPVDGIYEFQLHIHTIAKNKAEVQLAVGRNVVVSAWAESEEGMMGQTSHEMGSSNSMVLHLSRGQYVYCVLPKTQVLAGKGFTSFSGKLLKTDEEIGYEPPTTPPSVEFIDSLGFV